MRGRKRADELGIKVGVMKPGPINAITDVGGVMVGQKTLIRGGDIRTGVTAVVPHEGNLFREKVPAAVATANGFGKMAGYVQIDEVGSVETPIILTNTLSVATGMSALIRYTLMQEDNEDIESINAVVGETNDGYLNDIRGRHVTEEDVLDAVASAAPGVVEEGCVGAGCGTIAFRYKGGIGTASRKIPFGDNTEYTLGVLVQTNFGGSLDIIGAPVGRLLNPPPLNDRAREGDGSCMIVIATDAPVETRNLKRIARRSFHGLARTGSYMSNGSGDFAIAFSTAYRYPHGSKALLHLPMIIPNDAMTPFFRAVMDATQEAVYNSLFMATTTTGRMSRTVEAVPLDEVVRICRKYNILDG